MTELTRSGIAHNLELSPYFTKIEYSDDLALNFVFSSEYNKTRFLEKLTKNREDINSSLTNRFNMEITFDILCDIKLYSKVEKRGFYIIKNEVEDYKCQGSLELIGENVTLKRQSV